jgi:hypothetical protein
MKDQEKTEDKVSFPNGQMKYVLEEIEKRKSSGLL